MYLRRMDSTRKMDQYIESTRFIEEHLGSKATIGIILGTGLGALTKEIQIIKTLDYEEIPGFPTSTVESHHGRLIYGLLENKEVLVMQGRFHYYEGYSMEQITFPIRVFKLLGIQQLLISNASGGVNPDYLISDLMIIEDHINLLPESPLRGQIPDQFGPRFPDMSEPYSLELIKKAEKIAQKHQIRCQTGVYAAVQGPALETPAEYRYIRTIGADTVGMSTIPEVLVARQMNMTVFAISVITDLGVPGKIEHVTVEKVLAAASVAEPGMTLIIKELIKEL